ncbi:MAG: PleD family two-component system response regulator, partial [Planctomycetota bacterium]
MNGASRTMPRREADRGLELRGRVLVVEDDPACREELTRRLREAGHEVAVARDGQEAWSKLHHSQPELVVSDWMMPHLTGMELCRRIKGDSRLGSIYFLLLTAKDHVESEVSALDGGADDHLGKGCPPAELLARVRTGLRMHRRQARLEEDTFTDPSTGLRNQRYFDQRLQQEVALGRRHGTPLSLLLVDLDRVRRAA